ncbi:hypothetical protein ACI09C_004440 [Cronobacter turicensis]
MSKLISKLFEMCGLYLPPALSIYTIGYGLLGLYSRYKTPKDHSSAISNYVMDVTSLVIPVSCISIGVVYFVLWYFDNLKKYRERKKKSNW